jgi:Acyl-CoA dehydrogenase, N-terminal domain
VPLQELDWNDLFGLQGQLTEEERLIQRAARDRAQGRLAPRVRDAFRHEKTDPAIFREMGELGPPQVAWVGGSGDLALSSQPVAGFSGAPALDGDGHFAGLVLLKPAAVAASRDRRTGGTGGAGAGGPGWRTSSRRTASARPADHRVMQRPRSCA